jgi:pyruvate formate lyase activating enzyme
MDAANVDLKAFTEDFYRKVTASELEPVKDTLRYLVKETRVWTEITTLLIPGLNDSEKEVAELSAWIASELGPEVPLHFSAFHPDYRMPDIPRTPPETLTRARAQANKEGLRFVYTGNVHDRAGDTTSCPGCGAAVIVRDWYEILSSNLKEGACGACGHAIAGRFGGGTGIAGAFARRRFRVQIAP